LFLIERLHYIAATGIIERGKQSQNIYVYFDTTIIKVMRPQPKP